MSWIFTFYTGELDFYVRSVGTCDLAPGEDGRRKEADFSEIFWCISGSGRFLDSEGKEHVLLPGSVWYYRRLRSKRHSSPARSRGRTRRHHRLLSAHQDGNKKPGTAYADKAGYRQCRLSDIELKFDIPAGHFPSRGIKAPREAL